MNTTDFRLTDPSNHSVAATVTYTDSTHTATLTPSAALAFSTTVYCHDQWGCGSLR